MGNEGRQPQDRILRQEFHDDFFREEAEVQIVPPHLSRDCLGHQGCKNCLLVPPFRYHSKIFDKFNHLP